MKPEVSDTTVLLADDHPLIRRGLVLALAEEPSIRVIAEAEDGAAALDQIVTLIPSVAILDLDMPKLSGLDVARTVQQREIDTAIIILTLHTGSDLLFEALDLGVRGYILKSNATVDIVAGVRRVALGGSFLSASVEQILSRRALKEPARSGKALRSLTNVEAQIVQQVARGLTSREIADLLNLNVRTIENYRTAICAKLGLSGPNALLQFAKTLRD